MHRATQARAGGRQVDREIHFSVYHASDATRATGEDGDATGHAHRRHAKANAAVATVAVAIPKIAVNFVPAGSAAFLCVVLHLAVTTHATAFVRACA